MQIVSLIPQIVHVFAKVAALEKETLEVKSVIGKAATQLWSQYGSQLQPVFESLPSEDARALASVMSSK